MIRRSFGIVAVFATGALASRALAAHTPARFSIDVAQPLPVATAWGTFGAISLGMLAAMLLAALVPYAYALREPPRIRVTLATAAILLAAGAWFSPVFSSDVYAYAAYGEMARIGLDPYAHHALPTTGALFQAVRFQWPQLPVCVYGETFVALARAIAAAAAHMPVAAQLTAFRILSAISLLACATLCSLVGGSRGRFAAIFFACNPLVLWAAIEGHNDLLTIALVLGAIVIAKRNVAAGILAAAVAATIKLPALGAVAALSVRAFAKQQAAAGAGTVAASLLLAAAYARWFAGVRTGLAPHGHFAPFASAAAVPWSLMTMLAPSSPGFATIVTAIFVAAAFAAVIACARRYEGIDRLLVVALALWLLVPNPEPWYGCWLLAIAAFSGDDRLRRCALGIAACALLRYVPDAVFTPPAPLNAAMGLASFVPYVLAFALQKRAIISRSA